MTALIDPPAPPEEEPAAPTRKGPAKAGRRANLLLAPTTIWLAVFLLVPLAIVVWYSLGTRGIIDPVQFDKGTNWSNYADALDRRFLPIFIRSLAYATATTVACLLLGFPLAYSIARFGGRWKNLLLLLVILPFWTSYLVRMYAWKFILDDNGLANTVLGGLGLGSDHQFTNTHGAVIIGLTYGFLPFMTLPLYATIERLDGRLIEASYDLGYGKAGTLWRVTLPSVLPGIVAGVLLVFIPALGDFVTPELLGGTKTQMFGSTIQDQFGGGQNWPLGSAMAVVLMSFILIGVFLYARNAGEDVL